MSKNPVVSVLMPVYNAERYVAEAVESILAQTFRDFEFIIIDDGSTDGSLKILKAYAARDERIRLTSRGNKGLTRTLNEMVDKAKGEFLARMDNDDIALPERFALQVEFLQRESNVVWVGGAFELIDERGRLLTCIELPEHNAEIQQLLLDGHTSFMHPCSMIRRASLIEVGGYDETLLGAEDVDLWLRMSKVGALANLKDKVLKYRLNTNSINGRNRTLMRQEAEKVFDRTWQRWGLERRFEVTACSWRPDPDRFSRYTFMLKYGWWAFNSKQRKTAIIYGTRAIAIRPFAVEGWKLLACAAIKPLPVS